MDWLRLEQDIVGGRFVGRRPGDNGTMRFLVQWRHLPSGPRSLHRPRGYPGRRPEGTLVHGRHGGQMGHLMMRRAALGTLQEHRLESPLPTREPVLEGTEVSPKSLRGQLVLELLETGVHIMCRGLVLPGGEGGGGI